MANDRSGQNDEATRRIGLAYSIGRRQGLDALALFPDDDLGSMLLAVIDAVGKAGPTDAGSWLSLLEALLFVLRRNTDRWPHDLAPNFDAATELFVEFREIAGRPNVTVGPTRAAAITALLDEALALEDSQDERDKVALLVAHKLAQVIDEQCNGTFVAWLKALSPPSLVVEPERIYPVARDDPRRWMEGSANTRADTLPTARPEDAIVHARLGTDDHRNYRVVLDWSLDGLLAPLLETGELRIATFHANESLADFEIVCDRASGNAVNNGPADSPRLLERYAAMAERARILEANVVVVPEYALNSEDRGPFAASFAAAGFYPNLVAAGSARVGRHNEGCLLVFAGGPVPVAKTFNKVHTARLGPFREDIDVERPPEVPVWRAGSIALAVLICRDAQDKRLIDLLVEAGVNLCLVPSFSDRRSTIIGLSERFATETQGFVAVAIAPQRASMSDMPEGCRDPTPGDEREDGAAIEDGSSDSDDLPAIVEAYFKGPYGDDRRPPAVWVPADAKPRPAGPGLWLFESNRAQASWSGV